MKIKVGFVILLLILVGCQNDKSDTISSKWFVGVIETTDTKEKSSITFYDDSLNEMGTKNYRYADLSSDWNNPVYISDSVLLVPLGLMKKADAKKVISLNIENQEFTDFTIDRVNIVCSTEDERYVYAGSNLNGECYITRLDKTTKEVKEIKLKEDFSINTHLTIANDKLYEFYSYAVDVNGNLIDYSGIHIYNQDLDLIETIDLSNYTIGVYKTAVYQNKMYIPIEYDEKNDKGDNRMLVFDLTSYDMKTVELPHTYPNDMYVYNDSIIISHTSMVEYNGSMISVYDIETEKITSYDLECTIRKIDINDNILVVLTADDKLITYDIDNDFKKDKEIQLEYQSNDAYKSNIFVNKKSFD
jgi:hypothetical protein